jgi:hypothetical protein
MITLEFLAQIGVLVGTSAVLYIATQPNKDWSSSIIRTDIVTTTTTTTATELRSSQQQQQQQQREPPLRGMQRYSSYHRIRYYNTTASFNTAKNHPKNIPQKQA